MRKRSEVGQKVTVVVAASEVVAEASKKLQKELRKNATAVPPIEFDSANRAEESPLDPEFARIVESIFVEHPMETYVRLERALRVGEKRTNQTAVAKALDLAEHNARLAHRLLATAQVERHRWELDNSIIFAAMHSKATEALRREKTQGYRPKQITDADVDSMCAVLFPDEYRHQEVKRKKVKVMEDSMKNLVGVWLSRCKSLQVMLSRMR